MMTHIIKAEDQLVLVIKIMYSVLTLTLLISSVSGGNHPNCGTKGPASNQRIVGGTETKPLEFPWQGSLRLNGLSGFRHICGCAILNEKWIITASHCVDGNTNPNSYKIRLGEHDMSKTEGTEVDVAASKVIH